jgi:putative hydroxymethylpyrimidine transport system permease protein
MFAALIVLACLSLCLWLAVEALSRAATGRLYGDRSSFD